MLLALRCNKCWNASTTTDVDFDFCLRLRIFVQQNGWENSRITPPPAVWLFLSCGSAQDFFLLLLCFGCASLTTAAEEQLLLLLLVHLFSFGPAYLEVRTRRASGKNRRKYGGTWNIRFSSTELCTYVQCTEWFSIAIWCFVSCTKDNKVIVLAPWQAIVLRKT